MPKDKNNDQFSIEDILNDNYDSTETFSLESILSEYKGSAFIQGEKKTPSHELDDKVNEILRSSGVPTAEDRKKASEPKPQPKPAEADNVIDFTPAPNRPEPEIKVYEPKAKTEPRPQPQPINKQAESAESSDYRHYSEDDDRYFESKEFQKKVSEELYKDDFDFPEINPDKPEDSDYEEEDEERPSLFSRLFSRFRRDDDGEEPEDEDEEEKPEEPEPDLAEEMKRLAAPVPMLTIRSYIAAVIVIVMAIFTFLFEAQSPLPFGIGFKQLSAVGVLMILQLIVMALGIDVLISGITDLIHAEPGTDSLVFLSCLFTLLDGIVILFKREVSYGLSFSLVSAASVFFAMRGKRTHLLAYIFSLKMTKASSNPFGVVSVEDNSDPVRRILKKIHGGTDGFYKKLVAKDANESLYAIAVPILVVVSFLFAILASVGQGRGEEFTHTFSIMAAVCAAFPAASAFALPFSYAASILRKSGSALAGWGGVCELYDSDGALITDDDVFPVGSISLSGIKFFEGVNNQKAVVYGASLLAASETGLSRVFSELLRSQGLTRRNVSQFEPYEGGGIGGVIEGERVLAGTGAFMNLMGIRVPEKVNTNNAIFIAVNGTLAALFSVNYVPANSVATSLRSLLNTRVNVMFAVKDFNVTPAIISQKFRVSMDGVEYLPSSVSYELAKSEKKSETGISAILCREGLSPFAEVITKARLVKTVSELNSLISLGGTVIGILLMYFLCASGAYNSASSGNAFIFMLAVEACVFLLSQLVRKKS